MAAVFLRQPDCARRARPGARHDLQRRRPPCRIDRGVLGLVLRVYRRSALTTLTILIGSIGVFVFGMEFFVDRWLHQLWSPSWSLVVLTICIGMVIPLIIIRRVPALREEARRRFHL